MLVLDALNRIMTRRLPKTFFSGNAGVAFPIRHKYINITIQYDADIRWMYNYEDMTMDW